MTRRPARRRNTRGSSSRSGKPTPRSLSIFGSVSILVSLFASYLFVVGPKLHGAATYEWIEVPCRIQESSIRRGTGDSSNTKYFDVVYEYEIDGRTYQSDRAVFGLSSPSAGAWAPPSWTGDPQ